MRVRRRGVERVGVRPDPYSLTREEMRASQGPGAEGSRADRCRRYFVGRRATTESFGPTPLPMRGFRFGRESLDGLPAVVGVVRRPQSGTAAPCRRCGGRSDGRPRSESGCRSVRGDGRRIGSAPVVRRTGQPRRAPEGRSGRYRGGQSVRRHAAVASAPSWAHRISGNRELVEFGISATVRNGP